MLRPYILAETNWKHLKDATVDLAILPWGATEAHNYHLPYGTDNIEANGIAEEAARLAWERGAKVMVLPTIPFGINTGQTDIFLDINLNPTTQLAILRDVAETLNRQGVKKLLVFNSHGGNSFKVLLKELGLEYPEMFFCTSDWFRALDKTRYFEEAGDHADEMETSLVMYLRPELVLPLAEAGSGAEKKHRIKAFAEGWVAHERRWSQVSEDTGIGDPSKSSPEKGERYFRDVTAKFADLFIELAEMDVDNMYG
ncbi:creatinine amidohydrolase [Lewinella aquimaris]|uniref:Creatinine amidohydrolase n=1 Tax=Neolewinella aquimaris TaxID=1835722 RepID=A0A840E501_9BACT|nr:creatininase family protein [Neolewinella aquimaris]MBB4078812.1 creatinine amidohydrolase [Neolewinella aquimaris]